MRRWGWLDEKIGLDALSVQVCRPDLLASAVEAEALYAAAEQAALEGTASCRCPTTMPSHPKGATADHDTAARTKEKAIGTIKAKSAR
jgi:two-component system, oxyanion-binding sensor